MVKINRERNVYPIISFILLSLLLLNTSSVAAQDEKSNHYYPNSYVLHLPESWMKPKMIKTITGILPLTIDELKDREFHSSGRAAYCVHLHIDSVTVHQSQNSAPAESKYTFSFSYSFYAAFAVFDSLERLVSVLSLVKTDELFDFKKDFPSGGFGGVYEYEDVYDTAGRVIARRMVEVAKPIYTGATTLHSPFEFLTHEYLLGICEQRVYRIRNWLKDK